MIDRSVFQEKKASYYTLGCKLNFAETSGVGRSLLEQGVRTARTGETADICVINTCSVTEQANKKCRNIIRKAKRENPNAFIVVTGCYAQLNPQDISDIEGVNLVLGSEEKLDLVQYLTQMEELNPKSKQIISTKTEDIKKFQISSSSDERTRHFLKVQDGCDYHCTYCTIPKARGRSRNGTIAEIIAECNRIAESGGREIVLTGVNIGDFGRTTGEKFLDLLKALDEVEGIERFRIGSVEPNLLKEEIIDFCATSKRIAPHFHIPLQSGSPEVLKLMRRRYTRDLFTERVTYIRKRLPNAYIGVDIIVGSRGETEAYYEDCFDYLSNLPCSQLHVFSYSERPGTAALNIPLVVTPRDKHKRSQRLLRMSEEKLKAFYEANIGKELSVLWEDNEQNGLMTGFSENYVRVACPYDADLVGKLEKFTPTELSEDGLFLI